MQHGYLVDIFGYFTLDRLAYQPESVDNRRTLNLRDNSETLHTLFFESLFVETVMLHLPLLYVNVLVLMYEPHKAEAHLPQATMPESAHTG